MKTYLKIIISLTVLGTQSFLLVPWLVSQPCDYSVIFGCIDVVTLMPQAWLLGRWVTDVTGNENA